jgi:hypothetical protein
VSVRLIKANPNPIILIKIMEALWLIKFKIKAGKSNPNENNKIESRSKFKLLEKNKSRFISCSKYVRMYAYSKIRVSTNIKISIPTNSKYLFKNDFILLVKACVILRNSYFHQLK